MKTIEALGGSVEHRRNLIVYAGISVGVATYWALNLILSTLSDIALLSFGRDSGYDANPERAATYWAPLIGVLVAIAVVLIGFALLGDAEDENEDVAS